MKTTSLLAAVIALAGINLPAHEQYFAYDLGSLGGNHSVAYGINNAGCIVGYSYTNSTVIHAFCYSNGVMKDLGTVGGQFVNSQANAINNSGTIVGKCDSGQPANETRAFEYKDGTMSLLPLGGIASWATGVNDAGQIVGHVWTNSNDGVAVLYDGSVITELGVLAGTYSEAFAVSSTGIIVGYSSIAGSSSRHAFAYIGGGITDLGTLGGTTSAAFGINAAGTVVGYANTTNSQHAFSCDAGVMTDLGTLGGILTYSYARAINNSGTIVGYSATTSFPFQGTSHAFSCVGGVMTDLSPFLAKAGFTGNGYAYAINDSGWIVGVGILPGNRRHAFLLVPNPAPLLHVAWSNGLAQLTIAGHVGSRYAVEWVAELVSSNDWLILDTNTLVTDPQMFTDTTASDASSRFYRVRLV